MNKKGIELSLTELVKITIVIILLVAFLAIAFKLYKAFFLPHLDTEIESLDSLADMIDLMIARPTSLQSTTMILPGSAAYAIRGFGIADTKPKECGSNPCMCITDLDKNNKEIYPYCRKFNKETKLELVSFSSENKISNPGYPEPLSEYGYSRLFLLLRKSGAPVYVEKYATDGKNIVLLSIVSDVSGLSNVDLKKRSIYLTNCSNESSVECVGKLSNSKIETGFCTYDGIKCKFLNLPICSEEKSETECICGNAVMPPNLYCVKTESGYAQMKFDCKEKIKRCLDYCLLDDDKKSLCSLEEERFCVLNPCKLEKNCSMKDEEDVNSVTNLLRGLVSDGLTATISGTGTRSFIRVCTES